MISLIKHDSRARSQWGPYNLPRNNIPRNKNKRKPWDPSHWTTWLSLWWNLCWPWDPPCHDLRIPVPYFMIPFMISFPTTHCIPSLPKTWPIMAHQKSTHCIPTTLAWKLLKTPKSPILPGSQVSMKKTPRLLPRCRRLRGTARLQRREFGRRKARLRGLFMVGVETLEPWGFWWEFDGDFTVVLWNFDGNLMILIFWWWSTGVRYKFLRGLTHGIGIHWILRWIMES